MHCSKGKGWKSMNETSKVAVMIIVRMIIIALPEKQKEAFDIAVKNGYYKFPRKIDLTGLAKLAGVSASTFHENLRKAEAKLLPFFGH